MAKVVSRRKKNQTPRRSVNWLLLGGILALGVIALFALLFTTLQDPGAPPPSPGAVTALGEYCAENEDNCMEKGDSEAPVTIIEISDYGCSHCRDFNVGGTADALDEQYVESGQVHWIVVPYSSSSTTQAAAQASFCAAEQDRFFEYHRAMFDLFGTEGAYERDGILSAARSAGADLDAFESCIDGGSYTSVLQRNMMTAVNAGVRATPTFFINGRMVEGNLPLENFQRQIDQAIGS